MKLAIFVCVVFAVLAICYSGYIPEGKYTCRGRHYKPWLEICCRGFVQRKVGSSTGCCDIYAYNTRTNVCMCNFILTKPKGYTMKCCQQYLYNPDHQLCCAGRLRHIPGRRPRCCGRNAYDATYHECINGNIRRK